jgi:biopolymer transport protein ExbD
MTRQRLHIRMNGATGQIRIGSHGALKGDSFFSVSKLGRINRRQVDVRSIRSIIERLHAENPKGTVVIQADRDSRNNTLVQVMDASRRAGVYDIALAAQGD